MPVTKLKKFHSWQSDPEKVEKYRQEQRERFIQMTRRAPILMINVWSNYNGDAHDFILVGTSATLEPMRITHDIGFVLGGEIYDRNGQWVYRSRGGQTSHEQILADALSRELYGETGKVRVQ